MYISSDGTIKDPSKLNSEYIINAFANSFREIFKVKNMEEFNKYMSNLQVLDKEIYIRIDKFLTEKLEDDSWL